MKKQTGEQLLKKLKDGNITPEEIWLLEKWYEDYMSKAAPFDDTLMYLKDMEILDQAFPFEKLDQRGKTKTYKLWPRIGIAAAILLIIGSFAIKLNLFERSKVGVDTSSTYENDIAPGKESATLTLANGQKIKLSDAVNGELANEAGVVISKSADGQIIYEIKPGLAKAISTEGSERSTTNTLSTAKGETYQVRLPDGSLVALNAASSLTYATSLNERGERRVKLSGEAFFEISKVTRLSPPGRAGRRLERVPFIVESRGQEVQVLGTHFNINAYDDETATKTTLLEGSVKVASLSLKGSLPEGERKVTKEERSVVLKPNEQATFLSPSGRDGVAREGKITVIQVDVNEVIAWKQGRFVFNNASLEEVLRQLSRWYDVEIKYSNGVPKRRFTGDIDRNLNLSEALEILQYLKVSFKIEGRSLIVNNTLSHTKRD